MKTLPNLTEKESIFLTKFLANNACCADTPSQLLGDNFSCQTTKDLINLGYSKNEVAGFISSLESKNVLMIENDRGFEDDHIVIKGVKQKLLPDLYWVTDSYLEQLESDWDFVKESKNV